MSRSEPSYRLAINGKPLSLQGRLMSLTLTDNKGMEADQLDIEIDDSDGQVEIPRRGVKLTLALGWAGRPLTDKGVFVVDEVSHQGAPDKLTISARSADLRSGLRTQKEKSWHDQALGSIVTAIARTNQLKPVISAKFMTLMIGHVDQSNESDMAFLTRLAKDNGAVATVKAGKLLFFAEGKATTAGGTALTPIFIDRIDGDQHEWSESDREAYTGVTAQWQDKKTGKKSSETAGTKENVKTLRHVYISAHNARRAAYAELRKLASSTSNLKMNLALGRPDIFPEMLVIFSGFKSMIGDTTWIINRLTHRLDDSGLTTAVEATAHVSSVGLVTDGATAVRACWIDRVSKAQICGIAGAGANIQTLPRVFGNELAARRAAGLVLGRPGANWYLEKTQVAFLPQFLPPASSAGDGREAAASQTNIYYQLAEWLGVEW